MNVIFVIFNLNNIYIGILNFDIHKNMDIHFIYVCNIFRLNTKLSIKKYKLIYSIGY